VTDHKLGDQAKHRAYPRLSEYLKLKEA